MKRKISITSFVFAAAVLLVETLGSPLVSAKVRPTRSDARVVSRIGLPASTATDLFLRTNAAGQPFLYVAHSDHSITVLDVTHSKEPKEVDELHLTEGPAQVHLRRLGPDTVLATAASDPSQQLTVLNDTASPAFVKQFTHVDAYTIDGSRSLVYIAEKGKLSILQCDRPLTREAEIWEQSYESR
jgi:hypothetical protein